MAPLTDKKIVLVTGANQGLGFEIIHVAALREPSAVYILACRNVDAGNEAIKKLSEKGVKAEVELLRLDVTSNDDIVAAVKAITEKYGRLDVLIHNAGISNMLPAPSDNTGDLGAIPNTIANVFTGPLAAQAYNASQIKELTTEDLAAMRHTYTDVLNTNLTSVGLISAAFLPLLRSPLVKHPKVISVTSGLSSMTNQLRRKTLRGLIYGASKTGLNGLSVTLQAGENDRVEKEGSESARIRYFVVQPGLLKTAFTGFMEGIREPEEGAEVVVRLCIFQIKQWKWRDATTHTLAVGTGPRLQTGLLESDEREYPYVPCYPLWAWQA
ncbi:uncharacterized protein BP5553_00180 [Venustampulla echinocandica]|uniref:NAD(P)-binding protein n=1 Tax=Venustampulla echinocandica TaxID=2656787 RepID=A0A370TXE3_9HELO|nr:uncharacterized protein BP5553_00180 [Venustampulla echinocandica]RDL40201.1 hypothetical protein BP5553_00180 [Venustampulla echinocandica]